MIHNKIKLIRLSKNLTQNDMSRGLNICQNTYSLIENGKTKLDHDRIIMIAKYLDINPRELINETEVLFTNFSDKESFEDIHKNVMEESIQIANYLKEVIIAKDRQLESLLKQNEMLITYVKKLSPKSKLAV